MSDKDSSLPKRQGKKLFREKNSLEKVLQSYQKEIHDFLNVFPTLMKCLPRQAKVEDFEKYLRLRMSKGMSYSLLHKHFVAVKYWYRKTYHQELRITLPADLQEDVHLKRKIHILDEKELSLLFHGYKTNVYVSILRLIYATGAKMNEILNLRVKDIHFSSLEIDIRDEKERLLRKSVFSESQATELMELVYGRTSSEFVFTVRHTKDGKETLPISSRSVQLHLNRICQKYSLGKVTIHTLRDNFAIHLLRKGIDCKRLASHMGYRSSQFTERYREYIYANDIRLQSPLDDYLI